MNVKEVMELRVFEGAKVVAGQKGLNRKIKGVTIMEAPDIVGWLHGGELLLTSLYPVQKDPEMQKKLVYELNERSIAAMAIKTRRFVEEIPLAMLEIADTLNLPIIELPMHVNYVDIISEVFTEIISRQNKRLKYSEKVHKYFTDIALKGGTLEEIASGLAELVGNPVAILDRRKELLVSTDHQYPLNLENDVEIERQSLNEELHYYRKPLYVNNEELENKYTEVVVPISIKDEICGYLVVGEMNGLMAEHDFIALEHAATVVALELAKQMAVEEVERRFQNDFIEDVVAGKIESEETLYNRAKFLGWKVNFPLAVIVANIDLFEEFALKNKDKGEQFAQNTKEFIFDSIKRQLKRQNSKTIIGQRSDTIIALYPLKDGEEEKELAEIKKHWRQVLREKGAYHLNPTFSMGVGGIAYDLKEIPLVYKKALDALSFGRMISGPKCVTLYDELGIYRLLCQIEDKELLKTFIPDTLKKLMAYDRKNHTDLTESLEVYLNCSGNLKETAEKLFVHYKTILYRIKRIEDITGSDLTSNNIRLELQIGFKVLELLGIDIAKMDKINMTELG